VIISFPEGQVGQGFQLLHQCRSFAFQNNAIPEEWRDNGKIAISN